MNNVIPFQPLSEANITRLPPHSSEGEQMLLGAVMLNNRQFDGIADFLKPHHFAHPVNGRVFATIATLIEQGQQATPVSLKTYLERDELVTAAGGMKYLATLVSSVISTINARDLGLMLHDLYLRRELICAGEDLVNLAYDAQADIPAVRIMEDAEERLFTLSGPMVKGTGLISLDRAAEDAMVLAEAAHKRRGALVGLTTGLSDLDQKLGGLHNSDLLILAGRPSMGKTALATSIAYNAAKYYRDTDRPEDKGKRVAFFSLEMSNAQLATRVLSAVANVDNHLIRTGHLSNEQFTRLNQAAEEIRGLPLHIDDTPAATVATIRTRARREARKKGCKGIGLIVIDYLQLIGGGGGIGGQRKDENRVQEVSSITRGLKALAKDLNVPVLALSQLSRAVEQREDKRPQLSDLRESGTIEQDSDVVMFVFREQYYLERSAPQQKPEETAERFHERFNKHTERLGAVHGIAEVQVAKQRHGPIGTVKTHFDETTTSFTDLARDRQETRYMQGMD